MDIVVITSIVAGLFVVIGLAEPLADRLRLPFSVILALVGILLGSGATFFWNTDLTDVLNPVALAILNLPIRSNVFLYVFLPTLLFQVTLGMNLRRMMHDWVPILVLAVVAVIVATLFVGYALSAVSALPLAVCLLIGAIVSTTDPSAVVSIFRSIAAPKRLSRIIEGESLMNDAAAIALFGLFMGYVMAGTPEPSLQSAVLRFPLLMIGGAAVGMVIGRIAVWVMCLVARFELALISISVALPYLAYIVAEQVAGVSGVIAVLGAGLALNLIGPGRLPPQSWVALREVWDLLAHWSGALIFILAAILIPRLLDGLRVSDLGLIAVIVAAAIAARLVILFVLLPALTLLRLSPMVERPYRVAILWGGLRGAVTLALALAVTESALVPLEIKRLVGILATGFTLFTLMVQGTTLRLVIRWLGLDKLGPLDVALSQQVVAVALQQVREDVSGMAEKYGLTRDNVRREAKRFAERLDSAVEAAEASEEILDRDRVTLGLIALAGAERDLILDRFRERAVSVRLADRILSQSDRLIEATRSNGRLGYLRAARASVRAGGGNMRLAILLHNRLRVSRPLARLTADRFEMLLAQRLILNDMHAFIDGRIRRIHGRRVADLLHDLLERRSEELDQTIEGLRLQYPGYADELERRFIRRTALRLEEREYTTMREDGLIGSELYQTLMKQVADRRAGVERRPKLDLRPRKEDLIRQSPLFADLDDRTIRQLARALVPRYTAAGERVVRRDSPARSVYFIVSGAVEMDLPSGPRRIGRGELFGQIALLLKNPRRAPVTAIAPSTLLVLDEARFLKLLRRSASLQQAVRDSAAARGFDPEEMFADMDWIAQPSDPAEARAPGNAQAPPGAGQGKSA